MSRGDFSFMRPVRVRSRAVLGRYFFRSDHSTRLVVKEEVPVSGLCGTLVKPTTSLLGVWVVVGIGSTNSAGNSTGRRFNTARKRCNSNVVTSLFERVARELHAKLVVRPGCGARGRWWGLAGLRDDAPSRRLAARTTRGRAAAHGHIKQPGPSGHTKQPSGTGRRHDPRLGRQGTQSCNPQGVRNVGGATRPGHSQGRPDKRNDVVGGPAQAS